MPRNSSAACARVNECSLLVRSCLALLQKGGVRTSRCSRRASKPARLRDCRHMHARLNSERVRERRPSRRIDSTSTTGLVTTATSDAVDAPLKPEEDVRDPDGVRAESQVRPMGLAQLDPVRPGLEPGRTLDGDHECSAFHRKLELVHAPPMRQPASPFLRHANPVVQQLTPRRARGTRAMIIRCIRAPRSVEVPGGTRWS